MLITVAVGPPERRSAGVVQQFAARARKTGADPAGRQPWGVAATHLEVIESTLQGIGDGADRRLLVEGRRRGVHDSGRWIECGCPPDQHWMPSEVTQPRRLLSVS